MCLCLCIVLKAKLKMLLNFAEKSFEITLKESYKIVRNDLAM